MSSKTRGLLWVALAGLLFVVFIALVRYIGNELHPIQAAFLRYLFGLLVLLPLFLRSGMGLFRSRHIRLHGFRGCIHAFGVMLWFYAVSQLPIAEVTALSLITPIFVVVGAVLFLREHLTRPRLVAVILGLVGVLVILRPGAEIIQWGAIAMLFAAPMFATSKVLTKFLVRDDSSGTLVAYLSIFATLTMLIPAWWVWQSPSSSDLMFLAGTAIFATTSHLCMARGLALVDITVTQPIDLLQLVWSSLIGLMFFGEKLEIWVWIGAGIVVISATYIARLESRPVPPKEGKTAGRPKR